MLEYKGGVELMKHLTILKMKLEQMSLSLSNILSVSDSELNSYELGILKPNRELMKSIFELFIVHEILVHSNGVDVIDVTFDVYSDSDGNDPDTHSPTLNHYHYLLWNKKLPNGELFLLKKVFRNKYLLENKDSHSRFTEYSSDSIIHPFHYWSSMQPIIQQIPTSEIEAFHQLGSTIGGYIIFPSRKIDNKPTINTARGLHGKIRDRFDLTLECIRLHYLKMDNPLREVLKRYDSFFKLFDNFKGYVHFFLLDDMVCNEYNQILFWLPFEGFDSFGILPRDIDEYRLYMDNVMVFIHRRNARILKQFILDSNKNVINDIIRH